MRHSSRVDGEEGAVQHGVGGAEVGGRIAHVLFVVVHAVAVDGARDVVQRAEVVPHAVGVDGEVACVPGVGVPDTHDDEAEEEHADGAVDG